MLYCTLDSVYFSNHTLLELVDVFVKNGGKHLFLDEVHKYPTWSKEIRYIELMGNILWELAVKVKRMTR